jgi:hopanoid biosynthesis associated RND transporter like protein HpnN
VKSQIDEALGRRLARWVDGVRRRAHSVSLVLLSLSVLLAVYAATELGVNSDNVQLVSEDVASNRAHQEFSRLFPILDNALLVVIDADTPELSREAARALVAELSGFPERFREVYLPGGGAFFERNGLLYRSLEDLDEFADQMARMQPIIAELERDPSVANLSRLVKLGLEQLSPDQIAAENWSEVLDRVNQAAVSVYSEIPLQISWEELFLRGSVLEVSTRQVLVVDPVLDFDSPLPAGRALAEIRAVARGLGLAPERGIRVRITGNPALNYEEMLALAWDIGVAGIFCFLLVASVIYRALRSLRLTVAAIATLLVGLIWTAAFAAAAVGHVNLVSICFAILFIGLGVDFAIHLGMQYAALRREGIEHAPALAESARGVGSSLVLCTCTTAIGFYVFVPTDYLGVAELGLISGTGMLVILFMTLTLFPALISSWLALDAEGKTSARLSFDIRGFAALERLSPVVRMGALGLFLGALLLVPRAEFDPDVVKMRDPDTESVQAFLDLLGDNDRRSPWFANVLAPDLPSAIGMAERLRRLEPVSHTVTLQDYVPAEQEEKREILEDLAFLLDVPPADPASRPQPSLEEQVSALRELRNFLAAADQESSSSLAASVRLLRAELDRFLDRAEASGDPEAALNSLEELLLGGFPQLIKELRSALTPGPVALEDLPPELAARMVAPDGQARIQVFPRENLNQPLALERFVDTILATAPRATGLAVNMVAFGHVTVASLKQALVSALLAIGLILWLLWRRVTEMLLVLTPLLLGSTLTVASMVLLAIPFNFANVIVIPLVLGMGVDSGIHLVHRARSEALGPSVLMGTTTARAVFYSALTTVVSFGSLSFSSHPGMASLGLLLVIGMLFTLLANLVVLPALLAWHRFRST